MGAQISVGGSVAAGNAVSDNPVNVGGSDGTLVRVLSTDSSGRLVVGGPVTGGSVLTGNPVQVGGTDGTNIRAVGVNAQNQVLVNTEGQKQTYRFAISGLVVVASPTDIFTLIGSGSKTVRVTRIGFSMTTQTAAQYVGVSIVKRAAADTGGASTAPAGVPLDSANNAATAVCAAYTSNPTINNTVGTIATQRYFAPLTGTAALMAPTLFFDFGTTNGQALVLRGVAQQVAINIVGGSANASTADIFIEATEE